MGMSKLKNFIKIDIISLRLCTALLVCFFELLHIFINVKRKSVIVIAITILKLHLARGSCHKKMFLACGSFSCELLQVLILLST